MSSEHLETKKEFKVYFVQGRRQFEIKVVLDEVELCGQSLPRTSSTIRQIIPGGNPLFRQNGTNRPI